MPYAKLADKITRQRERRREQRARMQQSTATLPPPPSPPRSAPASPSRPSPRRALRERYNVLRQAGLSDAQAQARLRQQREAQQQRRKVEAREQQFAALVPRFLGPARAYLSRGGAYREESVAEVARMMAERSLLLEQPPLLQSPETLLLPTVAGGLVPVTTGFPQTDYHRVFAPPRE